MVHGLGAVGPEIGALRHVEVAGEEGGLGRVPRQGLESLDQVQLAGSLLEKADPGEPGGGGQQGLLHAARVDHVASVEDS